MPGQSRSSNKEGKPEEVKPSGMGNETSKNLQPDTSDKDPPDKTSRVNSKQSNADQKQSKQSNGDQKQSKQSNADQKHDPRNSNISSRAGSKKSADDNKRPSNPTRKARVGSEEHGDRQDSKNGRSTTRQHTAASGAKSVGGVHASVADDTSVYNFSDYYRPLGYGEPVLAARAVLNTAPVVCSCYPKRSAHGIPSMMYDRVTCEHHGVRGTAHDGVYAFDDGWSVSFETSSRPRTRKPADMSHVRGYPRPELEQIPESRALSEASEELRDLFDNGSVSSGSRGGASAMSKRKPSQNSQRKSITQSVAGSEHPPKSASPVVVHSPRRSVSAASNQHVQQGTQTDDVKDVPSRIMTFHRVRDQERTPTTSDIEEMHVPKIGYDPTIRADSRGSRHSVSPPPPAATPRDGRHVVIDDTGRRDSPVISKARPRRPRRLGVNYMVRVFTPVQEEYLVTTHNTEDDSGAEQTRRNGPFTGAYLDPVTQRIHKYEVARDRGRYLFQ